MASLEARITKQFTRLHKAKTRQTAEQQRRAYYSAPGPSLLSLHTGNMVTQRVSRETNDNQTQERSRGKAVCRKPDTRLEEFLEGAVVLDNLSTSPIQVAALKKFDPYHPANATGSSQYEDDLLFPYIPGPIAQGGYPDSSDASEDLIGFDPPTQLPAFNNIEPLNEQPTSVNNLLVDPDSTPLHQAYLNGDTTLPIINPNSGGIGGNATVVNKPEGQPAVSHSSEMQERNICHESRSSQTTAFGQPPPAVTIVPYDTKDSSQNLDENKERNDNQKRPSPATPQSRDRSRSKTPHSELKSSSPYSSLLYNSGQPNDSSSSRTTFEPDIDIGSSSQEKAHGRSLEEMGVSRLDVNTRNEFLEDKEIHHRSSEKDVHRNLLDSRRKLNSNAFLARRKRRFIGLYWKKTFVGIRRGSRTVKGQGKRRFGGRWGERPMKKKRLTVVC